MGRGVDEGVQVRGRWSSRWVEVWTRECMSMSQSMSVW